MNHNQNHTRSVPFSRSYWVIPGRFLAGCYPGSQNSQEADHKLSALLDHGIRYIVNLMEQDEEDHAGRAFEPYRHRMEALAAAGNFSVGFERMAIEDFSVPGIALMSKILDRIDQAIHEDRPVYVHCWGGRGRTGTVVGCYLARHGIAAGRVIPGHIDRLRRNTEDSDMPSPETVKQTEMVCSWPKGW